MKKKGFTLIELLAVIVILAIIALIATPLVLKYIEKSRSESKVDSAYSFVRNLETEMANYAIGHNGTKYNKIGLQDINSLGELNTTVKGENPTDGKVCISSLGEIEKAMLQYGNYYVSYDGKKANISKENNFDNFDCQKVVFEGNVNFVPTADLGNFAELKLNGMKVPGIYTVTISDANGVLRSEDLISVYGRDAHWLINQNVNYTYVCTNDFCGIASGDSNINGNLYVEVAESNKEYFPHVMRINSQNNGIYIMSSELPDGDLNVTIVDSDNNKLFEGIKNFSKDDVTFDEMYISCPGLFTLLENGKTITVTVTNGEKEYILGGTGFNQVSSPSDIWGCEWVPYYYWGNNDIERHPYGC